MSTGDETARELAATRGQWEALGKDDPLWAVLTRPGKELGRWSLQDFLATGEGEIGVVLDYLSRHGFAADPGARALDFGCGVGRLTQALAGRFAAVVGVDISEAMLDRARDVNRHGASVQYIHSDAATLPFRDGEFGFVYSSIVLQHVPATAMPGYIGELVRVLAPGGLAVFNVPDTGVSPTLDVATLHRAVARVRVLAGFRTRLRRLARRGDRPAPPMLFGGLPQRRVRRIVAAAGGDVVDVAWTSATALDTAGELRYVPAPRTLMGGKQYVAVGR